MEATPEITGGIATSSVENMPRNTSCFLTFNPNKSFFQEDSPDCLAFKNKFNEAISLRLEAFQEVHPLQQGIEQGSDRNQDIVRRKLAKSSIACTPICCCESNITRASRSISKNCTSVSPR